MLKTLKVNLAYILKIHFQIYTFLEFLAEWFIVLLQEILERTGYSLDVTTGQRKYGGPPPGGDDQNPPPPGCEVASLELKWRNSVSLLLNRVKQDFNIMPSILNVLYKVKTRYFFCRCSVAKSPKMCLKTSWFLCLKSVERSGICVWWWTHLLSSIEATASSHSALRMVPKKPPR
jgi:hypothetical protein